jgi:hypothetical protein
MRNDAIIYPVLANRSQRRDFEHAAKKAFDRLSVINSSFIAYVTNEIEDFEQYKFVYGKHLELWQFECGWLKRNYPKLTINDFWFEQNYGYEI